MKAVHHILVIRSPHRHLSFSPYIFSFLSPFLRFILPYIFLSHLPSLCPIVLTPCVLSSKVRPAARLEHAVYLWYRWVWHSYREQGQRGGPDTATDLRQVPHHPLQHLQVVPDWLRLLWQNHHREADGVSSRSREEGSRAVMWEMKDGAFFFHHIQGKQR